MRELNGSRWTEPVLISLLFAVMTIGYLWFAVRPAEISTRVQTLDSLYTAMVMDHVLMAPFQSDIDFWDLGIFYPISHTLCLSEPMITPAVFAAPFRIFFNYIVGLNLWIYFSWWSLAMTAWLLLKHVGMSRLGALWGGVFVAFNPDRAWHVAGHGHLFYASGLFFSLYALDKALRSGTVKWQLLFGFAFLSQIFAGIYLTAIISFWGMLVYPAIIWRVSKTEGLPVWQLLRRRGLFLVITAVISIASYAPIITGYMEFSSQRSENPLYQMVTQSATWRGYLLPPTSPERLQTLSGKLFETSLGVRRTGEDNQYIGVVALFLVLFGTILLLFKRRLTHQGVRPLLWCVFIAGGICYLLSLGPFSGPDTLTATRLPFAYLYAWFSPIHFFRAPARFAYGVEWSVAILGAWCLTEIGLWFAKHGRHWQGTVFVAACVLLTMVDFYPVNSLYRIKPAESDLSKWQLSQKERVPYVRLPENYEATLTAVANSHVPMANGYSGYAPQNRRQELLFFEKHFPTTASLCALDIWNVRHVFLSRSELAHIRQLESNAAFEQIWSGEDGVLFELTIPPPKLEDLRKSLASANQQNSKFLTKTLRLMEQGRPPAEVFKDRIGVRLYNMKQLPDGRFECLKPASVFAEFLGASLSTANYRSMTIKYKIDSWYNLREAAAIYFKGDSTPHFNESQKVEFVVTADGDSHEVVVPLSKSLAWVGQETISQMRIDLGSRPGDILEIESIVFE